MRAGLVLVPLWGLILVCCVSKTIHEQRFQESLGMSPPTVNVTLADPNAYTFAVVGDLHIGNQDTARLQSILTAAQTEGDAFVVLLGDLVDKGEREDVVALTTAVSNAGLTGKVFYAIGNHDVFYDGWTHYKELLGPSAYSIQIGNDQFNALDTADGSLGDEQKKWLSQKLTEGQFTRRFLFSHYLPLVPNIRTYLKLSNDTEALSLMALAGQKGVKTWFGAHYHSYSKGIAGNVTYLCAGGGGGRRMEPIEEYFFVQVRVAGDDITYEIRKVN